MLAIVDATIMVVGVVVGEVNTMLILSVQKLRVVTSLLVGGVIATCGDSAKAQIAPDGTLGAESSVITRSVDINGLPSHQIDGGAIRGANLFHSFEQFSIPTGSVAYFNNSLEIQNIISRVTGSLNSNIDGLIGSNGTANLFLLNPNGITFGPNASLNVGGSFLASTASSLNFADGTQFRATAPTNTPLLTVSVPLGLQLEGTAERILNQSQATNSSGKIVGLQVQPDETLALVGSGVVLEGGILTTDGGRIELGSVASPSLVSLISTDKGWSLGYEGVQNFREILLSQQAAVNASGAGGGDIQVQGKQVTLTDGSRIEASTLGAEPGGVLSVTASESVEVSGTSELLAQTLGAGDAGALRIKTGQLIVKDGSQLSTTNRTGSSGRGGTLAVTASKSVELIGIATKLIDISAELKEQRPSLLVTAIEKGATGDAGDITVETQRLIIRDGARISTNTFGAKPGGTLEIKASESVELIGTMMVTKIERNEAEPDVLRSGLFATTADEAKATATGGNLAIETRRLSVRDGATVTVRSFGPGQGGNLTVKALESVELSGTSANAPVTDNFSRLRANSSTEGNAGNLNIETGQLIVQDRAEVSVAGKTSRNAGNLEVTADSIRLDNEGKLKAEATSGQGGNIILKVQDLLLMRHGSQITATATAGNEQTGGGDGGDITINADLLVGLDNSDITANASFGKGGVITINAQGIFGLEVRAPINSINELKDNDTSDISAASQKDPSLNGVVEINTPDVDPNQGLVELPDVPVNVEVAEGCQTSRNQASVEFFNTGRGGLVPNPYEPLSSSNIWEDVSLPTQGTENPAGVAISASPAAPPDKIVEAQGWHINEKGEVTLVAEVPTTRSQSRCRLR